jgi:hypothetical protein
MSAVARAFTDGSTSPLRATHLCVEGSAGATGVGGGVGVRVDVVGVAAAGAEEGGAPAAVVTAAAEDDVVSVPVEHAASAPLASTAESTWRRVSSTPARRVGVAQRSGARTLT